MKNGAAVFLLFRQSTSQPASQQSYSISSIPSDPWLCRFLCLRLLRRVLLCTSLFPIKYHFAVAEQSRTRTRTSPRQFDTRKNKRGGGGEEEGEGENLIIDTWKVSEQSERKNDKWLLLRKSSELVVEVVWGREVLKRVKFITSVFCSYVIKISTWEDAMFDASATAAAAAVSQLLWRQFFVSKFFALSFDSFVPFEREWSGGNGGGGVKQGNNFDYSCSFLNRFLMYSKLFWMMHRTLMNCF